MLLQRLGWLNGEFVWAEREREHQCRAPCHVRSLSREREGTAESVKKPAGSEVGTWPVPDEVNVERRDASLDARPRRDHDVNASQAQEAAVLFAHPRMRSAVRARADQSDTRKLSYSVAYAQLSFDTHAGATCGDVSLTVPVISRSTARDRKSTRLNSSHSGESRMPSSA